MYHIQAAANLFLQLPVTITERTFFLELVFLAYYYCAQMTAADKTGVALLPKDLERHLLEGCRRRLTTHALHG